MERTREDAFIDAVRQNREKLYRVAVSIVSSREDAVPYEHPNPEQQRKTEVLAVAINEPYENWFAPNWFPEGE